ncbi:MAG: methyl-accepting chemotaxis protein [Tuberibacillus sp.]
MNWTIKKKIKMLLWSSLIGMIVLCLFMGFSLLEQHNLNKKANEINNAVTTAKDISVLMETARKNDQAYIKGPTDTGANLVNKTIGKIKEKNNALMKMGLGVGSEAKTIQKSVKSYDEAFKNLQAIKSQIGYTDKDGLLSSVKNSEEELTKLVESTHDQVLIVQMMKLKLAEQNYQSTPTEENYQAFQKEKDLLDQFANAKFTDDDSTNYGHAVLKLASSVDSIHSSNALAKELESDFNKSAQAVQKDVDIATNKLVAQREDIDKSYNTMQVILLVIMVVLSLGTVAGLGWFGSRLSRSIMSSIDVLKEGAGRLGKGNLKHRVQIESHDEMAELAESFNHMAKNMEETINKVTEAAESLSSSSQNLAAISEETSAQAFEVNEAVQQVAVGAQNQAEHLEESMALLTKVSQAIHESASYSEEIFVQSQNAQAANEKGLQVVNVLAEGSGQFLQIAKQLITEIKAVASESEKITSILKIIQDISSNTDLLALNAAIESARAGEAGRGFAVVSHEIRKLAERSKKETANIQQVIGGIIKKLNDISGAANLLNDYTNQQDQNVVETKNAFGNIADNVTAISEKITSIKEAITNVSQANVDLSTKLEEISAISEETAASTEQVSASSENQTVAIESVNDAAMKLQEIAALLEQEVSKFEVSEEASVEETTLVNNEFEESEENEASYLEEAAAGTDEDGEDDLSSPSPSDTEATEKADSELTEKE